MEQTPKTKTIDTLVEDIYERVTSGKLFDAGDVDSFGKALAKKLALRLSEERGKPTLRLSNLGSKCDRQLWYRINQPEKSEPLPASVRIKFLFGDILEEFLLFLARAAGHKVEGEQDEIVVEGVTGHRDGVIDGTVVDVKSASSYSFNKFEQGLNPDGDAFGYLTQLDGYVEGSQDDVLVSDKNQSAFLVVDKTLGKLTLDKHQRLGVDYKKMVSEKRAMLEKKIPPPRAYMPELDGKSGNQKLGVACSYCPFKKECWPELRTFIYSNGPRYFTKVIRTPDVPEAI